MKKTILGVLLITSSLFANAQTTADTTEKPKPQVEKKVPTYPVALTLEQWKAVFGVLDNYCPEAKQGDIQTIKKWISEPVNAKLHVEDSIAKIKPTTKKK